MTHLDKDSSPFWIRFSSGVVFFGFVLIHCLSFGQNQKQVKDSVYGPELVITPRFNSAGHFPFTGTLVNKNLNFDLNIFYEYRNYGFFLFKSLDFEDKRSIVNYLQPGIFITFKMDPALQMRVFLGYVFSQTSGFRDEDSDYYTAAVIYWTVTERLKLENTALFFDLSKSGKLANRLLMSWRVKNIKFEYYLWHRVVFNQGVHATSTSLAFSIPIKFSNHVSIINTFSYQGYISKTKPDFAKREGFLMSIAFPITVHH